jgi:hypothetical protein
LQRTLKRYPHLSSSFQYGGRFRLTLFTKLGQQLFLGLGIYGEEESNLFCGQFDRIQQVAGQAVR